MFAKLLKHEWRASRGVVGLLCIIILVSGLAIGGAVHRFCTAAETVSEWEEVVCVLLLMTGVVAVAVCCVASVFFALHRFYKRCFTDEGYLTFTLPVTAHQILLSSIVNSILVVALVAVAAAAAVAMVGGIFILTINTDIIWADVWTSWERVWPQIAATFRENAGQILLAGFSGVVSLLAELVVLMLSITVGTQIAKKHKVLASVGVYYAIGMGTSLIYTLFVVNASISVNAVLGTPGLLSILLAVGSYFAMYYLISRKLNLT